MGPDLSFNYDQGAARVVHVRNQHFVPAQLTSPMPAPGELVWVDVTP